MEKFICSTCGRKQIYKPKDESGGITIKEAESVGWRKIKNKWKCPFCCDNTDALFRVFNKSSAGKKQSAIGKG